MDILLVDDDETLSQSLTLLLQSEGYNVTAALSGEQALELAALNYYGLVLCDVRMPGMDGLEAIEGLKELVADADFIVMTGYASEDAPIQALRLGVDDYLAKPFDLPEFMDKIRSIARRRRRIAGAASPDLRGLISALRGRFPSLADRCARVEELASEGAKNLKLSSADKRLLSLGAWLHPLSKSGQEEGPPVEGEPVGLTEQLADLLRRLGSQEPDPLSELLKSAIAGSQAGQEVAPKEEPVETQSGIVVKTLGQLRVAVDGTPIAKKAWQSANARWIFVYLLTRRCQAVPESRLAELFWPGSPPAKAHRALVSSVHRARKALGDSSILARYDRSYGISRECEYSFDYEEFLNAYKKGCTLAYQQVQKAALECFTTMEQLYEGDFIPECDDSWCQGIREDLKIKMVDAFEKGASLLLETEPTKAESWARRALQLDNVSEPAWAVLLQSLGKQGRRNEVETAFRECAETLLEALGLKPGQALQQAYRSAIA